MHTPTFLSWAVAVLSLQSTVLAKAPLSETEVRDEQLSWIDTRDGTPFEDVSPNVWLARDPSVIRVDSVETVDKEETHQQHPHYYDEHSDSDLGEDNILSHANIDLPHHDHLSLLERKSINAQAAAAGAVAKVPTCVRKKGHLRMRSRWAISYKAEIDREYNGEENCGRSVLRELRKKPFCAAVTGWTCFLSGDEDDDRVNLEFYTSRLCTDKSVHNSVLKGVGVSVWCKHPVKEFGFRRYPPDQ